MNTVFAQRLQYLYSILALGNLFPKPTINWYISSLDNPLFPQISLLGRYLYKSQHMWYSKQLTNGYGIKVMVLFQVCHLTQHP